MAPGQRNLFSLNFILTLCCFALIILTLVKYNGAAYLIARDFWPDISLVSYTNVKNDEMFSDATDVLCCRHSSRCSFGDKESAILRLKPMKRDCRVGGLGLFAKCIVCAQIPPDACFICRAPGGWWPLLECPTERNETNRSLKEQDSVLPYKSCRHGAFFKCTPGVDICHLAPSIIGVGIWHWLNFHWWQGGRPRISALPSDTYDKDFDWKYWHCRYIYTYIKWNVQGKVVWMTTRQSYKYFRTFKRFQLLIDTESP